MKKIELYDTTLRDGSQTEGISYSVADKVKIARKLDELGVAYIEGGFPGSNPKDRMFFEEFKKHPLKNAALTAFGATRKAGVTAKDDPVFAAILHSGVRVATIFGKSWDLHVRDVLRVSLEENLEIIRDSVKYLVAEGLELIYDAEHFFDAYKHNRDYAMATLLAAQESGARLLCLCDTNGGTLTSQLVAVIADVQKNVKLPLGIHVHNDLGLAVGQFHCSASRPDVSRCRETINGYGERCGNADLIPIVGILKLKMGFDCITDEQLLRVDGGLALCQRDQQYEAGRQPAVRGQVGIRPQGRRSYQCGLQKPKKLRTY
jgi:2-isopropylmalate synthase